jgi:hypothetical protein
MRDDFARDVFFYVGSSPVRPDCRFSGSAAYPSGRLGSLAREDLRLLKAKSRRCPILSSDLTARWWNDAVHTDVYDQLAVMVGDVPQSRVQHFKPIVARVWAFHGSH